MKTKKVARILILDDGDHIHSILRQTLEKEGYEIIITANGKEALFRASESNIDVAILDVKIPGRRGTEVLFKLKDSYPDITVIILSDIADGMSTHNLAMAGGAFAFLTKPANLDDVIATVEEALEQQTSHTKGTCSVAT